MDVIKWLASFIPRDPETKGGLGPFNLPERCAWMEPAFKYHDYYYDIGPKEGMRLSDIDWRIFKVLVITAEQATDPMERCHRAKDICRYWPIMRSAGHYLYNRHAEE
jgi:hypothetical protein